MPLQLSFVTSAKRHIDLPDSPCEVAFVGRSNVGKSSLINALANRKQLARVSNTPGRTQLLNLFTLPALVAIHRLTGGFPRKVINLCHQCILTMIIQNRKKVGWRLVRCCSERVFHGEPRRGFRWAAAAVAVPTAATSGRCSPSCCRALATRTAPFGELSTSQSNVPSVSRASRSAAPPSEGSAMSMSDNAIGSAPRARSRCANGSI